MIKTKNITQVKTKNINNEKGMLICIKIINECFE